MKVIEGQLKINTATEVLDALPRTMCIDGIEIIRKVKISIKLKIESAAKRLEEDERKKEPGIISLGYRVQSNDELSLDYDTVIEILNFWMSQKKVARTNAEPLPTFQRID